MIETHYNFTLTDKKVIERIVDDAHANLNHVVLGEKDALPEHYSNSNVYLVIVQGVLSARFGEQDEKEYPAGSILHVPYNVKMNMRNGQEAHLEFFIFKAPHPDTLKTE